MMKTDESCKECFGTRQAVEMRAVRFGFKIEPPKACSPVQGDRKGAYRAPNFTGWRARQHEPTVFLTIKRSWPGAVLVR
ncbi:hypothetical protein XH98_15140 [Bradyrhizobium sp. CCBAU 51745]|nr:hypothetical protein [Bradyrhizobium sp. CCBAU 51745]